MIRGSFKLFMIIGVVPALVASQNCTLETALKTCDSHLISGLSKQIMEEMVSFYNISMV